MKKIKTSFKKDFGQNQKKTAYVLVPKATVFKNDGRTISGFLVSLLNATGTKIRCEQKLSYK